MTVTVGILFLIAALVLFVFAASGASSRINLTAAGLACCVVAWLIAVSG